MKKVQKLYKMKDNGKKGALNFAVKGSCTANVLSFLLSRRLDIK